MAKKFFYDKVYNTKRTIINVVIIGVCVIGIILCFVITSSFQSDNSPSGELSIKEQVSVELNEEFDKKIFFSKVENVDLDEVTIKYPNDFDISKLGNYEVTIIVNRKEYTTNLSVIDTTKPELVLKELTIHEETEYEASDFVDKCEDNSKEECKIEFYKEGLDEEGEKVDYSSYSKIGDYSIKIVAIDDNKNEITKETKLHIVKKGTKIEDTTKKTDEKETNKECKYGTNEYDKENDIIAIDLSTDGCAINLELYKDTEMTEEVNKVMDAETNRILTDMEKVNVDGTPALNRKVTAITNKSNLGIVGYELRMTVTITKNNETEVLVDYKVDSEGKRVFIKNPYNIPS